MGTSQPPASAALPVYHRIDISEPCRLLDASDSRLAPWIADHACDGLGRPAPCPSAETDRARCWRWKVRKTPDVLFTPSGPSFWELAQQAMSSTQRGYDLVADKFDQSVFRTPDCIVQAMEEQLSLRGPFEQGLDVGCGTGALSQVLTKVCTRRIVGLDPSEGMLAKALAACPPLNPQQTVEFWQGDILQLEGRGEFDVCTCFGMFGHLEAADHLEMLRRIHASLRPSGHFVFVLSHFTRRWTRPLFWFALVFDTLMKLRNLLVKPEFVMYYLSFPLTRARRLLEEIGYRVEIVDDVFPAPYTQLKLIVATRI